MFYILSRCAYYKEGQKDREKTGIKRLLSNGTYTAAFPLHDVRHVVNFKVCFVQQVLFWHCVGTFAFSVGTGKRAEMQRSVTTCTSTGPGFSAFIKSSPSTSSSKQTHVPYHLTSKISICLDVKLFICLQEVLRRKDRDLLCLVGFLHRDALFGSCCGPHMFHLWSAQLWWQHNKVSATRGHRSCLDKPK